MTENQEDKPEVEAAPGQEPEQPERAEERSEEQPAGTEAGSAAGAGVEDAAPADDADADAESASDATVEQQAEADAEPEGPEEVMPGEQLSEDALTAIVEALLFVSDDPINAGKMAQIIGGTDGRRVRSVIKVLQSEYAAQNRAFQIEEVAGGFKVLTLPEYHPWVAQLQRTVSESRLSQAALETLAIIAYRQPVLRADVESVRGVQCGQMLRTLIERGLVKVVGHDDQLGRPLLYGTTNKFLESFGLKSLKELPKLDELTPGS